MTWHTTMTAWLRGASARAYTRKGPFLGIFALVFVLCVLALGKLDLLPSIPATVNAPVATESATTPSPSAIENPVRIVIDKVGVDATITNPSTTDITVLDELLLKGAVRYPTSAKLGETGNVVVFGHSSYLPVVGNQAYKTFNGIQKLVAGDTIAVYSAGQVYTYRVTSMTKESAASDAGIPLNVPGKVLTLSTCNSFGTKSDRFVVVADFVESHSIPTAS